MVEVNGEVLDESLVEVGRVVDVIAEAEVDVLGQSCVVTEANLECHATFEYPLPWLCRLDAGDDALEHYPSA